ncbi:MAG TPA: MFS transporter [Gaiellaceae bacterium]|nr:MFS transporter [Gaiellaceae bacterium]
MDRKWWTLIAVCTATFMLLLDITIVNVALPAIERALDASFSDLQWVVDAYALALATCVLTAGALADLFGRKRLFVIGIVLFTLASAACGLSNDPLFLIVARGVQGLGGAIMFATALALISQEFHGRERGTAFGIWGATVGAAVAIGPLAGGMLTSWLNWRWIFLVNIPIGVAAVLLSLTQLRESSDPAHSRLDPLGLVTLTGGLLCLILALIEGNRHGWSSALIVGLFAGAVVLLAAFVASQTREGLTMVDLSLFRRPAFVGAQVTAFAISSSMFAMFLYLTLYLQNVLGLSPLQTGVRFLPLSVVSFFAAPAAGRLSSFLPVRLLLGFGLGLVALALWLMSGITASSNWTTLLAGFIVGGIGIGMVNAPLASTAVSTVQVERAGMASGINNTFRQLGIATGIAALGALFSTRVTDRVVAGLHGVPGAHTIAAQLASGQASSAVASAPADARARVADVARTSFISGLNHILVLGAIVSACGAVLATLLVRRRDFVASGPPPGPS